MQVNYFKIFCFFLRLLFYHYLPHGTINNEQMETNFGVKLVFFFLSHVHAQELIYVSDGPNYSLIHILLAHLQEDLRLYVSPPDGTREHPATTCLELWFCHPEYSSGQFKKHI